ncbi:hypothetical protein GCM10007939_22280 [Amylibacter marinus]|uniref:Peptidase C14 caspase domain-containing protein n=2 Tax=Amylibacter marinus TaxID=1475483 RepID=A0ABQ5VXT1_9RHOB|nr:hypothetical protein GCM10007939_22280 [Amylibacter marinus]
MVTGGPIGAQTFPDVSSKDSGVKFGLVILNSTYDASFAPVEETDANRDSISYIYKNLGFSKDNVVFLENPNKGEISASLALLNSRMPKGASVLVYYHGNSLTLQKQEGNLLLLSGLRIPGSSDQFLWDRRLKRGAFALADLVDGFAQGSHVTVFYDACRAVPLDADPAASHWKIIKNQPCDLAPVTGANVIYGHPNIPAGGYLESMIVALSEQPTQSIESLDLSLREAAADEFGAEGLGESLLRSGGAGVGGRCLAKSEIDGVLSCFQEAKPEPVAVAEVPKEPDQPAPDPQVTTQVASDGSVLPRAKGLQIEMSDEEKAELADIEAAEKAKENAEIVQVTATAESVAKKKAAMAGKLAMAAAWKEAKASNACADYQVFLETYPKAFQARKAKKALAGTCEGPVGAVVAEKSESPKEDVKTTEASEEPKEEIKVAEAPKPEAKKPTAEQLAIAWAAAKKSDKCADYEAFIAAHKNALQNVAARQKIDSGTCKSDEKVVVALLPKIEDPKDEVAAKDDKPAKKLSFTEAWAVAKEAHTCHAYMQFREDYPSTVYAFRAKTSALRVCSSEERKEFTKQKEAKEEALRIAAEEAKKKVIVAVVPKIVEPEVVEPKVEEPKVVEIEPKVEEPTRPQIFENNKRYALMIVNAAYDEALGPVAASEADRDAVLKMIKDLQIPEENILVLQDREKNDLEEEVFEFASKMKPASELLFYYSGHSMTYQQDNSNHIIPSNFTTPTTGQTRLSKRRFAERTIPLKSITRFLLENNPRQLAVIYNGCGAQALPNENDEPHWEFLLKRTCSNEKLVGASAFYPVKDGQIAAATIGDNQADPRSPYIRGLTDAVSNNLAIDFKDLQVKALWSIASEARKAKLKDFLQEPVLLNNPEVAAEKVGFRCFAQLEADGETFCSNLEGNSIIAAKPEEKVEEPVKEAITIAPTTGAMIADWDAAKSANTCEAYLGFKAKYPNSVYGFRADALIKDRQCEIEPSAPEVAAVPKVAATAFCTAGTEQNPNGVLKREGFRALQVKLNAVGCNVGAPDGAWGRGSQGGLDKYFRHAKINPDSNLPTCALLDDLQKLPNTRICPLVCNSNQDLIAGKCVTRKVAPKKVVATPAPTTTKPKTEVKKPTPAPKKVEEPAKVAEPAPEPIKKKTKKKKKVKVTVCVKKLANGKCAASLGGLR